MRRFPASLLLAFGLLSPASAGAQDYDRTTGQSAFTSIVSLGASPLSISDPDDGFTTLPLPFDVSFYGHSHPAGSALTVSVNGFVAFGSAPSEYQNAGIPSVASPNGFIAAFWDDLELGSGGLYQGLFSLNTGEQVFIIEYADVQIRGQPSSRLSFQIWIVEGGQELDIHFGAVGTSVFGSASIGLESPSGALGLPESCSPYCTSLDVTAEQFIGFTPRGTVPAGPADLLVTSLTVAPAQAAVGSSFDLEVEVANVGQTDAGSFELVAVLDQNGSYEVSDPELGRTGVTTGLGAGTSRVATFRATVPGSASGTYTVRIIADPNGLVAEEVRSNNLTSAGPITIQPTTTNFEITTRNLPPAAVGEAYSFQLEATAGSNPAWSIVSGDPGSGLSLSPAGVLAGIPAVAGTAAFRVQATDLNLGTATWDFVLTIIPPGGLRLVSSALPRGAIGSPYSARLAASGGTPPYAFLVVAGAPAWFQLRSDGEATGTPDALGVFSLEISVADSAGAFAGGTLRLEVTESRPLRVTTTSLPVGVIGFAYETQLSAEGGAPPYSWALAAAPLPDGLSLEPSGRLSGLPSAEFSAPLSFVVRDSSGASASAELSLAIEALKPLEIVMPARVALKLGAENELPLLAVGGVPPYSFALGAGRLPNGVELVAREDGSYFAGIPTSTVPETITLLVTDQQFEIAEAELIVVATVDGSSTLPRGGERARRGASGCRAAELPGSAPPWLFLVLSGIFWRWRRRAFVPPSKGLNGGGGAAVRTAPDEDRRHPWAGL